MPFSIAFADSGSIFSSIIKMVTPFLSSPLLPARPDIWMYSPPPIHRNTSPSNLRTEVNTTVLAGMLIPIEKVSVENRILSRPAWNSTSTVSFSRGSRPPWWIPMPFNRMPLIAVMVARSLSTSSRTAMASSKIYYIFSFCSLVVRSYLVTTLLAKDSTSLLLKLKMMAGSMLLSIMTLMILDKSDPMFWLFFFFCSSPTMFTVYPSSYTALLKWLSWNLPFSSTTRYSPSPPAGHK